MICTYLLLLLLLVILTIVKNTLKFLDSEFVQDCINNKIFISICIFLYYNDNSRIRGTHPVLHFTNKYEMDTKVGGTRIYLRQFW